MRVFHPFYRDANRFLEEIEYYFPGTFLFDNYYNAHRYDFDICHIHWPEVLTERVDPSVQELKEIETFLNTVKTPVVFTLHNDQPHRLKTKNFLKLYELVIDRADLILHYGAYSLQKYKQLYPSKLQGVLKHSLYERLPNVITRKEARKTLKLKAEDSVVLVFGSLRSVAEEELILLAFDKLNLPQKRLLITKWTDNELRSKTGIQRSISYRMRKRKFSGEEFIFMNKFVREKDIQIYFNAADVLLIPRLDQLNSGLVYLAATFNTPAVGIGQGNVSEELKSFGFISTLPTVDDFSQAIQRACEEPFELNQTKTEEHSPKKIAKEYFDLLSNLVDNYQIHPNQN